MNCAACGSKTDLGEMIRCNGCKTGFHHKCVNITSTAFKSGQAQLKRTFKCDSCLNVTQRIRVTDDTPVRGASTAAGPLQLNQSIDEYGTQAKLECLTSDEIIDKVNSVIMAKICDFETNIMKEIKATVAVLALENSKLRQELKEANMRCSSYEQKIKCIDAERLKTRDNNCQQQNCVPVPIHNTQHRTTSPKKSDSLVSTSRVGDADSGERAPLLPSRPETSYAAVARKTANTVAGDSNGWIEVQNRRKINPVLRGGNNSIASLKAVERRKFLHVWRLDKSTTEENLKEHILNILGNDSEIVIVKLRPKTERDYASFKIGVTISNFEKLCDPEIWPVNVEFSEWIWFRRSTKPNNLETE